MRTKEDVVREFATLEPKDSNLSIQYRKDRIMLEVFLDIRDCLVDLKAVKEQKK